MKNLLTLTLTLLALTNCAFAQDAKPECCDKPGAEASAKECPDMENGACDKMQGGDKSGPCPMEGGECDKFGTDECRIRGGECDDMKGDCPFEGDGAKAPCADCKDPGKCEDAADCAKEGGMKN